MDRMDFLETLPSDCPPPEAEELTAEKTVYRIAQERPPTLDDFRSQRCEKPKARFNLPECFVCGVSVFTNEEHATAKLKLPKFKGMHVARIRLFSGSGCILQTFAASHHTLWPSRQFHPLEVTESETL